MRVLLFTGKGGVGKTTLAAATGSVLAAGGHKTLVVSTDPAHSLGDALAAPLRDEPLEVAPGLFGMHVDVRRRLDASWQELRTHLCTLLASSGVDEVLADELTLIPGLEELLALQQVADVAASQLWETVIVDCAPTAETLRLLALPEAFAGYLERLFPRHRRAVRGMLAGLSGAAGSAARWDAMADALSRLAERFAGLRDLLADHDRTGIRLVLTPERVVAAETRRTLTALALYGMRVDGVIANRLLPDPGRARSAAAQWLRSRRLEQAGVLAELAELAELSAVPMRTVEHTADEPIGVSALTALGRLLYGDADPLDGAPGRRLLRLNRVDDSRGGAAGAQFELAVDLPGLGSQELDLARIDDELIVTVGGRRRLITLPSVLRRCVVSGARTDREALVVSFRPDPELWMS